MSDFSSVQKQMSEVVQQHIYQHRFVSGIVGGTELSPESYVAYLRETFHLVRETPFFLTSAAARTRTDDWLHRWFVDLAVDERGHDLLCVRDLRHLGKDPEKVLAGPPCKGTWMMISQNHYMASVGNPIGIIGFAAATEGLGAELATGIGQRLETQFPFTRGATSFLHVHGHEDPGHLDHARKAFDRYATDSIARALMIHVWRFTIEAYGQLFTDVLQAAAMAKEATCAAAQSSSEGAVG